jgi:hypothetical protein
VSALRDAAEAIVDASDDVDGHEQEDVELQAAHLARHGVSAGKVLLWRQERAVALLASGWAETDDSESAGRVVRALLALT